MNSSRRFKIARTIGFLVLLGIWALLTTSRVAYAQDAEPAAPTAAAGVANAPKTAVKNGAKRTEINFEDQLIEGSGSKPGIFFFMQQKGNSFKKLIKLRENFLPEMRRTSDEVVRKGSGN